jgi:Raf kinase inhibitor-like YbhB/YbcL family protein
MLLRRILIVLIVVVLVIFFVISRLQAAARRDAGPITRPDEGGFTLASSEFEYGQSIPVDYTADGMNLSPPLGWVNEPEGTVCYALVLEDPDARFGTFTHWLISEISGRSHSLPEGVPKGLDAAGVLGAVQGKNDFAEIGYGGPDPPAGKRHRYEFHLYALEDRPVMMGGFNKHQLRKSMEGHILDEAVLIGTYQRAEE